MKTALRLLVALLFALPAGSQALASGPESITIKVGFGAGAGYDASARAVSRHLGRFLPGEPGITVQNLPGGGSMRLTRLLLGGEPTDGSVIGVIAPTMAVAPKLDPDNADYDPLALRWIGALARGVSFFCVTSKASGIETMDEFLSGEFAIGASGRSSLTYVLAAAARNGLGAKFNIVTGFEGNADIWLAIQRGEIAGNCAFSPISLGARDMARELNFIGHFGEAEIAGIPDTPRLTTLIEDPLKRQAAELIETALAFHYPFVAPAGIDQEALSALRDAFAEMVLDPAFIADVAGIGDLTVDFVPGAEMEAVFLKQLSADQAVFDAARELMK